MRVCLLTNSVATAPGNIFWPKLDSDARIVPTPTDGAFIKFQVQKVSYMDKEVGFMFKNPPANAWEVYLTDERVAFWSPYVLSMTLKAKQKTGSASVGHLYYNKIYGFQMESGRESYIDIMLLRADDALGRFRIEAAPDVLWNMANTFCDKLSVYWEKKQVVNAELSAELNKFRTFSWDMRTGETVRINHAHANISRVPNQVPV